MGKHPRMYFKLESGTEDLESAVKSIIASIPTTGILHGLLWSNKELALPPAMRGRKAGYLYRRGYAAIVGGVGNETGARIEVNATDITESRDPPAFVEIEANCIRNREELLLFRKLVRRYLIAGYRGSLRFEPGPREGSSVTYVSELISIEMLPWTACGPYEYGQQDPRVLLESDPQLGGHAVAVLPVRDACESMELTQYEPKDPMYFRYAL